MRVGWVWMVLGVGALVVGACSLFRVGEWQYPCSSSDECASGYTCVAGECRATCAGNEGCPVDQRCVEGGCVASGGVSGSSGSSSASGMSASSTSGASMSGGGSSSGGASGAMGSSSGGGGSSSSAVGSSSSADMAPFIQDGVITVDEDQPGEVLLPLSNVSSGVPSVQLVDAPQRGAAQASIQGSSVRVTYTPTTGLVGPDRLTVRASSAGGVMGNLATVTIHVVSHRSCAMLQLTSVDSPTPLQRVDPDGPLGGDPFDVACDFSGLGGGWTLVLKVDGGQRTFAYEANLWTNPTLFAPEQANTAETQTKLSSYWTIPVAAVRVDMRAQPTGTVVSLQSRVGTQNPTSPATLTMLDWMGATGVGPTFAGRAAWEGLVPGSRVQDGCLQEGLNNNPNAVNALVIRVRLGLLGNDESHCGSPDSVVGVGINNPDCSGNNAPPAGNYQCANGSARRPAFAWVWLREDDFTALPSAATCQEHRALGRSLPGFYRTGAGAGVSTWCP